MAGEKQILSGLAQGFAQGQQRKRDRGLVDEFKKAQINKFKADMELREKQIAARDKLKSLMGPSSAPQGGIEGPPQVPEKGKSLSEIMTEAQFQGLLMESGVPIETIMQANQPTAMQNIMQAFGGNKDFMLKGVQVDSKGKPRLDFERPRLGKEVPDPGGKEIIQLDQFGREFGRRPIGPGERSAEELKTAGLQVQQEFKLKPALSTVDQLESLYQKIIDAQLTEKAIAIKLYNDFVMGTVAPLVKAGGESGSLAKEDIDRALQLLPNGYWAVTPFTSEIGAKKFDNLREWFKRLEGAESKGKSKQEVDPELFEFMTEEERALF